MRTDILEGNSVRGASKTLHDWGNITTSGLPWLQVGLVPFKVAPFGVYTPDQSPLQLPEVSLELLFPVTVQHHLLFISNLLNILDSSLVYLNFHPQET